MSDLGSTSLDDEFVCALTESQTALRGYCRASLGHGGEAAEALQRANIILWKKNGDWDRSTEFMKWAITVAKYEVLGVIRDRNRERDRYVFDSDVVEMMIDESQAGIEEALGGNEADALEVCLSRLSDRNREVLSAYYSHGYSMQEVADRFEKRLSAMKVMLLRLRRKLGDCIEQKMSGEGAA